MPTTDSDEQIRHLAAAWRHPKASKPRVVWPHCRLDVGGLPNPPSLTLKSRHVMPPARLHPSAPACQP